MSLLSHLNSLMRHSDDGDPAHDHMMVVSIWRTSSQRRSGFYAHGILLMLQLIKVVLGAYIEKTLLEEFIHYHIKGYLFEEYQRPGDPLDYTIWEKDCTFEIRLHFENLTVASVKEDVIIQNFRSFASCKGIETSISVNIFSLDEIKTIRLVVMDFDSTLIQQEVVDEIAALAGPNIEARVKEITLSAMKGNFDFEQSLRARVALFAGMRVDHLWTMIKSNVTITQGAHDFCNYCKTKGIKLAICSGGFLPIINYIKDILEIDFAFGNELEVVESNNVLLLSGKVQGEVFGAEQKAEKVKYLANSLGIPIGSVMAFGDGANDIPMLKAAGLGIAFNAKLKVQENASYSVQCETMSCLKHFLNDDERC